MSDELYFSLKFDVYLAEGEVREQCGGGEAQVQGAVKRIALDGVAKTYFL